MFLSANNLLARFSHEKDEIRDRAALVRTAAAAFLVTLALSWRVYVPDHRLFAMSPVFDFLAGMPAGIDWALFATVIGCLCGLLVKPLHRPAAAGVLVCTVVWVLQDYMRLQPYTYMYFFTILFAVFSKMSGLDALRIMVAGVYFWGGSHKLNATFYIKIFPWFIEPFYVFPPKSTVFGIVAAIITAAVPIFEAGIGILLVFPRQRRLATLMAFIMLVVVLLCLGPLGHNQYAVVWPWNIYLFLVELILFCAPGVPKIEPRGQAAYVAAALFAMAPALAFFGAWPSYAAFKLFAGNTDLAVIQMAPDETGSLLPDKIKHLLNADGTLLPLEWTQEELNVTANPEAYVLLRGSRGLCPYLSDPKNARLRVIKPPPFFRLRGQYEDYKLCL